MSEDRRITLAHSRTDAWNVRERVVATLSGAKPDRLPFIDHMEAWYDARLRAGTIPPEFAGLDLTSVHRALRFGQQRFVRVYSWRLRGVELTASHEGDVVLHERDPLVDRFPQMLDLMSPDRPGVTTFDLTTPVGRLRVRQDMREESIEQGLRSYLVEHPIKDDSDLQTVQWVLERMEFVPRNERLVAEIESVATAGLVVPSLDRLPFQQLLIDYFGEVEFIYALYDKGKSVLVLLQLLHERVTEALAGLKPMETPYVEFIDNMTGSITSPSLFEQYCLPHYHVYTDMLHAQGKKVGSHLDGNLRPLLGLIPESGLDVCESFSPVPLSPCTFDEVWDAWRETGPIIWGGIPSTLLDEWTPETEFRAYVDHILEVVGDGPVILGIVDHVMRDSSADRIRYIADRVEEHVIS